MRFFLQNRLSASATEDGYSLGESHFLFNVSDYLLLASGADRMAAVWMAAGRIEHKQEVIATKPLLEAWYYHTRKLSAQKEESCAKFYE